MNFTQIDPHIQTLLKNSIESQPPLSAILEAIHRYNGKALLVGGAVRDLFLQKNSHSKDFDIEVYGLTLEQLEKILSAFGPISLVGKSFGVLRLHGLDIDWSIPRSDLSGRHPIVSIDPFMSYENAFRRRDLTINAMGIDLHSFSLIDPYNGLEDLRHGILRAPDARLFGEDPLRLLRVMQFISRFEMKPDSQLSALCKNMSLAEVSLERIESEFDKLFLKSLRPSLGIRWLEKIGQLQFILPELFDTIDTMQNPAWHPEGSVFEHTMQAIDAAARQSFESSMHRLIIMYAVLCHDLGKVTTSEVIDGVIRSPGHDVAGVPLAKAMLKRLTRRVDLIASVARLVREHMAPGIFIKQHAGKSAYKRLALRLAPYANIELLGQLAIADKQGRNGQSHEPLTQIPEDIVQFLEKARALAVDHHPEEPIVKGRDLLSHMKPGPGMGRLLKNAYEIQIEEGITDKKELLDRILKS